MIGWSGIWFAHTTSGHESSTGPMSTWGSGRPATRACSIQVSSKIRGERERREGESMAAGNNEQSPSDGDRDKLLGRESYQHLHQVEARPGVQPRIDQGIGGGFVVSPTVSALVRP